MIDLILKLDKYYKMIKCIRPMVGDIIIDRGLFLKVVDVIIVGNSNTIQCTVSQDKVISDEEMTFKGWSK